jgi:DNA helicase IV
MREQTRALATLDQNQNVYVQGSAGTGKTKLALQWARRALSRDDSTIITCFNIPLGHYIASQFSELDEIYAGYFEDIVAKLPGLPPVPAKPTDPTQLENYYGLTLPRHILKNIDKIEIRFDTVIVDEIQDFHAMWVHVLLALLRSDGPRRFLTVGDEKQNLHGREGVQAVLAFRPTRAELRTNCRNAQRIGELLHSMGGAEVASASPEGEVFVIEANTIEEATEAVITEVQEMLHTEVWDADRILIATIGQNERQALLAASTDALRFTSYEESAEGTITCETVHRAKGLEYDVVVLVAPREDVRDQLMYVGASRAITRLVVVAPKPLFARMGIA